MAGQRPELIAEADARGLDTPLEIRAPALARRVVTPGELGVDADQDRPRHPPGIARGQESNRKWPDSAQSGGSASGGNPLHTTLR